MLYSTWAQLFIKSESSQVWHGQSCFCCLCLSRIHSQIQICPSEDDVKAESFEQQIRFDKESLHQTISSVTLDLKGQMFSNWGPRSFWQLVLEEQKHEAIVIKWRIISGGPVWKGVIQGPLGPKWTETTRPPLDCGGWRLACHLCLTEPKRLWDHVVI